MTRNEAFEYIDLLDIKPKLWNEGILAVDTILAIKQFEVCNNCIHFKKKCETYRSVIKENPETYPNLFGCNKFKPYKELPND